MAGHLGSREVVPDQSSYVVWQNITVDTGAAQSTLQDIKVPEYGGGYVYVTNGPLTRNRYIFWRVNHDVVELWEESLELNLTQNYIRLRFADTPVLEGLSVHETGQYVIILLATVSSVHQIRLVHPSCIKNKHRQSYSIFSEQTHQTIKEHHSAHVINHSADEGLPHTASTHLGQNEMALYILAQSAGTLLVVQMDALPFAVHTHTIKHASLINRLFTGFVPGMFRPIKGGETVSSLVLNVVNGDTVAFGISLDGRLRAWSCSKLECIMAHNTLENTAEVGSKMQLGAQRHLIRSCEDNGKLYLGIFLNFSEKQLLLVYSPSISHGQLVVSHIKTLYPPQNDLVDLTITSTHIWSTWIDARDNDTQIVYYAPICSNGDVDPALQVQGMVPVALCPLPDKEVPLTDSTQEPQEAFLNELFKPNRFSASTLLKALHIYRRNLDTSRVLSGGIASLQEEVKIAMREEIESRLTEDLCEEEINEITLDAWTSFYSHTLQYHQVGLKAVGMMSESTTGVVSIIRKHGISFLRPMDAFDHLALTPPDLVHPEAFATTPILSEDTVIRSAVVALMHPLRFIQQQVAGNIASAFNVDLFHLQAPDQVCATIASMLIIGDDGSGGVDQMVLKTISKQISKVSNIVGAIQTLLRALQLDLGNPDELVLDPAACNAVPEGLAKALSSRLGTSVAAAVVMQIAEVRLELCRNLLLLQHVALDPCQQCHITPESAGVIRSTLMPQTVLLTQAYYTLFHLTNVPVVQPSAVMIEASLRQLSLLSMSDSFKPSSVVSQPMTVTELFINGVGSTHARNLVLPVIGDKVCAMWTHLLVPLATTIAQLIWPISRCFVFPEFLLSACQYSIIQEYVRLLQNWCEWNSSSRKFLMGMALLNQGEARKAYYWLIQAADGVITDDFLATSVIQVDENNQNHLKVLYYLKVVLLFEQFNQPDLILEVIKTGVSVAAQDDPNLAVLYSLAFKYHLELEHYDEAFTALTANPDVDRQRNCLRQLVVTLHENKALQTLVNYEYGALEDDVVTIIENRARSADILINNYYDLLFAFHVLKHNYKKAAHVMYECGLRLNQEGIGQRGLRQQVKCYLTCLNCLAHLPPDHAWIVKPVPHVSGSEDKEAGDETGAKRSSDGTLAPVGRKITQQVVVLEVGDIQREYELIHARLKLRKTQTEQGKFTSKEGLLQGAPLNAEDTVSLLTHGRLYRDALHIAELFGIQATPVIQGLAVACLVSESNADKMQDWQLLAENGISRDSGNGWWTLLKELVMEHEKGRQTQLHQAVVLTFLQNKASIPTWLINSYKKRNCGELLRIFVNNGMLEDGVRLACEYIDGLLGHGTAQVGLENALHTNAAPVWVPYTALDHLLLELNEVQHKEHYRLLQEKLKTKLSTYQECLERVTKDLVRLQA
ncbi:nuclear pore complex protein Nup160 isoform X2 [Oratosquilla oratoria]|uniref:nuclear pore complex protein Nup160 isoform X2 n=1 Tax=Oratosquilla oratoria TaxID=337810 RepID=UPI003F76EAFC